MNKKVLGAILMLGLPVAAQLQQVLSIVVNGVALQGKALIYKGRVYVAVEDLAIATGGTYSYNPTTHLLQATIPQNQQAKAERPWLKVVSEKKVVFADNAVVYATIKNTSKAVARNVEVNCSFRGDGLSQIGLSVQRLPQLQPGETAALEFTLPGSFSNISYTLKMNYQ